MDPLKLPGHNSTSYPLAVKGQLDQLEYTKEIAKKLRLNQYVPKEFFTRAPGVRGLLVYAGMGQGKTRLATAVAEESRALDPKRRVIILLAKSIEGNFAKTVEGFSEKDAKYVKANYRFVSLNAGNMIKTMSSVDKSEEELKYEKRLGEFMKNVSRGVALENSLLVVDEAHNLFNGITNGSKNALGLYDLIMKTRNIKLLFLTGTPVINNPFELVPCFNMARGPIRLRSGGNEYTEALTRPETFMGGASGADEKTTGGFGERKGPEDLSKGTTRLFSENYDEFANFFVDKENRTIKNKEKFANRIFGLTSYYGDLYFEAGNKPGFPKELPTIVERVPMGEAQFTAYLEAREGEREENSKGFKGQNSRFRAMQGGSSTYRVKSRQISNYRIPDYALGPARGRKARQKFIGRLKIADLHELGSLSPKMARVLLNINKHQGQPGLVYSQFVSGEGIGIFQRVLEAHNYVSYDQVDGGKAFGLKNKVQGRFAVLSGAISVEQREAIITLYNSKANADGSKIALLLLSGAVAEGIDLKRTTFTSATTPRGTPRRRSSSRRPTWTSTSARWSTWRSSTASCRSSPRPRWTARSTGRPSRRASRPRSSARCAVPRGPRSTTRCSTGTWPCRRTASPTPRRSSRRGRSWSPRARRSSTTGLTGATAPHSSSSTPSMRPSRATRRCPGPTRSTRT
jgi:hypothetical protein